MVYDYAVVGKGLIGAAAGRYLSAEGKSVALIGPDEPQEDWQTHEGVFASHYDQGRITRGLDSRLEWALWAQRSIQAYQGLEQRSSIRFHYSRGCAQVGLREGRYLTQTEEIAQALGTPYDKYRGKNAYQIHPALHISDQYDLLYESPNSGAGYVNPRELVSAQLIVAQQQGATIVRETVRDIQPRKGEVTLVTTDGQTVNARQVLVTAGAWTEFLTGADLGLIPTPRTILLAKIGRVEAMRLEAIPAIIFYEGLEDEKLSAVYSLPPIEYPDGHTYIKIGGKMKNISVPQCQTELHDWFKAGGSQQEAAALEDVLRQILPDLQTESVHRRGCVVTLQKNGPLPVIKAIVPGQVMVAAAGAGAAAKSSNEIGRIAATALQRLTA